MGELKHELALKFAESLTTIGHPRFDGAILATAQDLIDWCKGCFIDGCPWPPERQAQALIDKARYWPDGWPSQGGTARLYALFREMFDKKEAPSSGLEERGVTYEQAITRGMIRPPCVRCDDGGYVGMPPNVEFCSCRHGRHQKTWEGERGLQRINTDEKLPSKPPRVAGTLQQFTPITEEQMKQALEDEKRRKEKQLGEVGLD